MVNLTTVALVKEGQDITGTDDDAYIGTLVAAASTMIENICKRTFTQTLGTLYYDPAPPDVYGGKLYFGQAVQSVAHLIDASGTIDASKYRLLPRNGTPKYGLELKNTGWTFSDTVDSIAVIATYGMYADESSVPADLRQAATKLAQWMYQTRDNTGDTVHFANGDVSIPANAPPQVMTILERGRYIKDRLYV
jgi:hypothetical protein